MRQQAGAGDAALDRSAPRRRMDDGVAAGTRERGAHIADHAEGGRYPLQLLGHILAQLPQPAATGEAGIGRRM